MQAISNQTRLPLNRFGESRAAIAYATLAGGPAGVIPFAALWLRAHGAPIANLGVLIALPLIARTILAKPLASWAAGFPKPSKPVSLLCGLASLASLWALFGCGIGSCVVAWWVICFSVGACTPLMDNATLGSAIPGGERILAKAKSVGAIAYMAANIVVGFLFARFGAAGVVIWAGLTALVAATVIPQVMLDRPARQHLRCGAVIQSLYKRSTKTGTSTLIVLVAAAVIEASHGFNAIAMVSWAQRGYDPGLSGMLWSTGIVADVIFLMFMGSFRARVGPARMLILGGLAAVVRWAGFATAPALPYMFALQTLHAFSFTATYLASVELVHKLSNDQRRLPTQAMNWAFSTGLGTGLSVLCAGPLYMKLGTRGYWVMCGVAVIGLVLAIASHRNASFGVASFDEITSGQPGIPD